MATAKIDNPDLELMAHFDDELEGSDSASDLADEAARVKLEALAQISAAVQVNHEAEMREALDRSDPFASMWSAIERQVTTNGKAEHAAREVEADEAPAATETGGFSAWGAINGWLERYRSQMMTGALCAVAAAVLVWFVRPPDKTVEYVEVRANAAAPQAPVTTLASTPAELESLEVYDGSGVVLTIPADAEDGEDGAATTVIWLSPPNDEESVEGPI